MVTQSDGVLDDLLGFEIPKVNRRQPGVGLVVDEQPVAVVVAARFAERRVVSVRPGQLVIAHVAFRQDLHRGNLAVAPALPGFGCEDSNSLQHAH